MPPPRLPTELWLLILTISPLTLEEQRSLRLVNKMFDYILKPMAFSTIRLGSFTKTAFDGILGLAQSPLAEHVKCFEYKVNEHLEAPDLDLADRLLGFHVPLPEDFRPEEEEEWYMKYYRNSGDEDQDPQGIDMQKITEEMLERRKVLLAQTDVLGTMYDAITLAKALPAFSLLSSVNISFFDVGEEVIPGTASVRRGWPSLTKKDTYCYLPTRYKRKSFETAFNRAFWTVIKALNLRTNLITHLRIDTFYVSTTIPSYMKFQQLQHVLGDLKSFSAPYISPRFIDGELEDEPEYLDLIGCLDPAKLETLQLGEETSWELDDDRDIDWSYLRNRFNPLQFENLTELALRNLPNQRIREAQFKAYVQMPKLKKFSLVGHRFIRESDFPDPDYAMLEDGIRGRGLEEAKLRIWPHPMQFEGPQVFKERVKRWERLLMEKSSSSVAGERE